MKARKRYTPPPMTRPGRHLGASNNVSESDRDLERDPAVAPTRGRARAPEEALAASQAPTMPPPAMRIARGQSPRPDPLVSRSDSSRATRSEPARSDSGRPEAGERPRSGVRARKSQQPPAAATVDEVTADMSKDPRRED